ncbi:unnamed protein product [Cladocopium goreaui]|uniref:Uncharacterized protein n=1 Tax=Cladocopium goreaui TaxID=2562237 RepID=A0A9P1BKK0_9DINO|nr:unnamed protein product [Cladocopium goreaui]CAI3988980.1 unnamed protein product [Cladocopium goreaui]
MQTVSSVNEPIVSNQNAVDRPPLKRVKVNTLKPGECKHTSDDGEFSSFYLPQGKTAFKFLQRFTVGRNGEEVVELQHPILRKCFVIPCIAGFTCTTLLQNESDKVDWGQVYYALVLRVRSDIVLTKQRVQNALVLQKVRVTASKFVPNLDYFSPSRGFLTEPQLSMVSGPLTEFFLQKIQAQVQEKGKNMTPTIRFGCALLCKAFTIHADNTELFEEVLVHFRDKDVPFALTGGVVAEQAASFFYDAVHGQGDKRCLALAILLDILDTTLETGQFVNHVVLVIFEIVVEATKWSRQQQLANRPVEDIRAYEVCSGGSSNWSLRLISNGRYVSFEAFRSKVDAILWTYVSREIYKHPHLDLHQIMGIKDDGVQQDWDAKLGTIKKFGDEIVKFVESKAPKDPNQQMLEQMEKLKEENALLKHQMSQSTSGNPPPAPSAPARPNANAMGPMDAFVRPGNVDASKAPLDQYRRKPPQPALLSSNSPKDGTPAKIRDWIQGNLTNSDQENLQALTQTIQEELTAAGPDEQPAIDKILVDWGLSTVKVNKMKHEQQIKLLAAVQFLKH